MAKYIMALDAGTTSNRCILFNEQGEMCSVAQKEFTQYFPQPGWVEHDANEIWSTQIEVAQRAMANIGATAADIAAIGITNQRVFHSSFYEFRWINASIVVVIIISLIQQILKFAA